MRTRVLSAICLALSVLLIFTIPSKAEAYVWYESDEGYEVLIDDEEDILSDSEEKKLAGLMKELAEYGNVVFYSTSGPGVIDEGDADRAASDYYESLYGSYESGMIFVVVLDNNHQEDPCEGMLWLNAYGELKNKISSSQINSMTYNSVDKYYDTSDRYNWYAYTDYTFQQVIDYFNTGKISEPMKWITNVFLAAILALMISFAMVSYVMRSRKPKDAEVLSGLFQHFQLLGANMILTNTTKVYDPPSSSGGGGGRGGGGGGGGHSGGGHRA